MALRVAASEAGPAAATAAAAATQVLAAMRVEGRPVKAEAEMVAAWWASRGVRWWEETGSVAEVALAERGDYHPEPASSQSPLLYRIHVHSAWIN